MAPLVIVTRGSLSTYLGTNVPVFQCFVVGCWHTDQCGDDREADEVDCGIEWLALWVRASPVAELSGLRVNLGEGEGIG